jgi:hypothetical protein
MKPPVDLPGYSECDARPDGGYVAARLGGTSVRTHLDVDVPCGYTVVGGWVAHAPRYPRCTVTGPFKVAVQGNDQTLEWLGSPDWHQYPKSCGAPGPVIYDRAGQLHISDCSGAAEGYHHVAPDGSLVWGNRVTHRAGSELRESTDLGDGIYPGQGPQGGFWVQMPDGYREIAPGIAMVIRATRVGNDLAFAWYEPNVPHRGSATAHLRWMTIDELCALPVKPTSRPPWQDEPSVPVPTFGVPDHPIAVHIFGGPGFRMNLGPGHDRDPHAAPSGAFVTIDHDDEAAFQQQADYARQHGVPLFQYLDKVESRWASWTLRDVPGVRCVAAVRCYPNGRVDDVEADLRTLAAAGIETAVVIAGYRQMKGHGPEMNWTLLQAMRAATMTWAFAVFMRTIRHALIFHQRRESPETGHVDGLDSRPELQEMADRIVAAAAAYVPAPELPTQNPEAGSQKPEAPALEDPMPTNPPHALLPGQVLYRGGSRRTADGRTVFAFQDDGNIVLYHDGADIWAAHTQALNPVRVQMQPDGHLVAVDESEAAVWGTGTHGHDGAFLSVREVERDAVVALDGTVLWQAPAPVPVTPQKPKPQPRPSTGGGGLISWLIGLFKKKPKPQQPLPNPEVPPAPPVVVTPPAPQPVHRPPVVWPMVGLSHYLALGDPDFDWPRFLDFSKQHGVGYHRTWLIDAWATKDIGGLYDGFLPCRRRSDGRFDLFDWRAAFFARLRTVTDQSNERGIVPLWTLLELYSWSTRKQHATVPDANWNLFRFNVNGISWGTPDDKTFGAPPFEGEGLPDHWFRSFCERVLEALGPSSYALLVGNETPEKDMHWRIETMLRDLGYQGEIVINRNEDGPGQPFNMGMVGTGGHAYDRHEFHVGTADESYTSGYLDHEHPEEAPHGRPTTLRELFSRVDPARLIISSDGDGGRIVSAQTALAREVLQLGGSFERQCNLKRRRFFVDGSLQMSDLDAEIPFLTAIRS